MIARYEVAIVTKPLFPLRAFSSAPPEQGQRRTGKAVLPGTRQFAISLLLLLFARGLLAQREAGVTGTVRDLQGKPQMGVLVELLNSTGSATALTDLEGHYLIKNVLPGVYSLRATATLYLPSLRRQLRLQPSMRPIVNLTMTGLFDETSWMTASRPDGPAERDDWKWTLRSPANRPMLRWADAGAPSTLHRLEQGSARAELHGELMVESAQGNFGAIDKGVSLMVERRSSDQKRILKVKSLLAKDAESAPASPRNFSVLLESESSAGAMRRSTARLSMFPQIRSAQGDSLREVELGSAERVQVGEFASVEAGSEVQLLSAGPSAVVTHPFLRLTSRPVGGWSVGYAMAMSPHLTRYDDLNGENTSAPSAIRTGQSLTTESGLHQEVVVRRALGKATVQVIFQHDSSQRTALSGRLLRPKGGTPPVEAGALASRREVALDCNNGTFRSFAPGFSANGLGAALDLPVGDNLTVSAGYLAGSGIILSPSSNVTTVAGFAVVPSRALLASVKARVARSGTRVSISYRWQPATLVSKISPYAMTGIEPYLGVHVRQSLPSGRGPWKVEFSIDGDNVAGQAFQAYSVEQQEAFLASALRDLRAGLSVSF